MEVARQPEPVQDEGGTAREFVVVAAQRTGSTLLVRSLDSVPEIFCAGEIFHAGPRTHHREFQYPYQGRPSGLLVRVARRLLQGRRVRSHLAHFYGEAGKGVLAVGFKLMASQADRFPAIVGVLREREVTRIFLHRRNAFDAALSYCMAATTGRYHSDRRANSAVPETVTFDEADFERYFRACLEDRARLLELHGALGGVMLAYEDLERDWDGTIARIGDSLGVHALRAGKSLEKLSGADRPRVANEDALRRRFEPGVGS